LVVERKILIPMFNIRIDQDIDFEFDLPEFIKPHTHHYIDPNVSDVTVDKVRFKISIMKCNFLGGEHSEKLDGIFPTSLVTKDIYCFGHHTAETLLIISVAEEYPDGDVGHLMAESGNSHYEYELTSSFLLAMKLVDDSEPHFYKGVRSKDGDPINMESTWPLKEMQGSAMSLTAEKSDQVLSLCNSIWKLESQDRQSMAYRIISLSCGYYSLTSTQTEYSVIFMFLMIAFEALFKKSDAESIGQAKKAFGKLVADTKKEYSVLSAFMSENPNEPGCCFYRNAIVHGNEGFNKAMDGVFWQLKGYTRVALHRVLELYDSGKLDKHNYYESLYTIVNERFNELPS